jgi:hypothetical protein
VSTSNRFPPLAEPVKDTYAGFAPEHGGPPARILIDPDNPPWGLVAATLTWFSSVALLFLMSLLFVLPYLIPRMMKNNDAEALREFLLTDKTAILLQISSTIPAHLLTLAVVWAVVTHFGKLPFWSTLGWSWTKDFGPWKTLALALVLYVIGIVVTEKMGGEATEIDKIVNSSQASRYTTAFLATFTAPLVEEMIYRGVLYSALRKWLVKINIHRGVLNPERVGTISAVCGVLLLFTIVHVPQYRQNIGVILVICLLSMTLTIVRAYTGRLLPCFIIHLVFNGTTSLIIIFGPYIQRMQQSGGEQKAAVINLLAHAFNLIT